MKRGRSTSYNAKPITAAESYGWVVEDSEAWEAYDFACEYFGEDNLNGQIIGCLSYDELAACLAYIFRMNDFREWEQYKNGEEEEEEDYE